MQADAFERLVADELDELPEPFLVGLENVAIVVEDRPPEDGPQNLLGLYHGVPMTERVAGMPGFLPDLITVYREPHLRVCDSEAELRRQVRYTLIHEIGHFMGMSEGRLHELGYG